MTKRAVSARTLRFLVAIAAAKLAALAATLQAQEQLGAPKPSARETGSLQTVLPSSPPATKHLLPPPVFVPRDSDLADPQVGTKAQTLSEAIAHSYRTNPRLSADRATLRATDFAYPAARAAYGPQLEATGTYRFVRDRIERLPEIFTGDEGWTSTAALVARMPLLTFGRNKAAEADALAQIAFRRDVLRITESEILTGVVSAYVAVLRDAGGVAIARDNLKLLDRQLGDNRARFAVREITASDLEQVETRFELANAQLLEAQGRLGSSQGQFLRFVGLLPGELAPPAELILPVATLEEAYAVADRESPVIRAAQSREKVSRAAAERAKADFLPRVDLTGSADYGTLTSYSDSLRTTQLRGGATMTVPLIDSGLRNAELGRAREANLADWRLIESAFRDTRAAVADAWSALAAARGSLERYRRATVAAQRAYDGAVLQQRAGLRTTLEVLDLARDLLTLRTNYNTALAEEYLARADLLSAMGRLEAPLLIADVEAYDPEAHYRKVRDDGDIPLLTAALSALDGITAGDPVTDRPNADLASELLVQPPLRIAPGEVATPPLQDASSPLPGQQP